MSTLNLTASITALVLIDLQNAIVARELAPHPSSLVVQNSRKLAEAVRAAGGTVVYVHVDLAGILQPTVDAPRAPSDSPPPPVSANDLVPEAGFQTGDFLVTKRHWGAFYATDLDQHLRRHRVKTIILGGIATNYGVESTARAAAERAYEQVFVEDAMTSFSAEAHGFSIKNILPRLGRIRSTAEVIAALAR
ncbi:MAG: isochorismatase family protein [Opitutaceae bacterium]